MNNLRDEVFAAASLLNEFDSDASKLTDEDLDEIEEYLLAAHHIVMREIMRREESNVVPLHKED